LQRLILIQLSYCVGEDGPPRKSLRRGTPELARKKKNPSSCNATPVPTVDPLAQVLKGKIHKGINLIFPE
jgi:hypothetical protein